MNNLFDNTQLGATELGIALWAEHKQRFTVQDVRDRFGNEMYEDVVPFLMGRQVLAWESDDDITNSTIVFVGERKKEKVLSSLEAQFEEFRIAYRKLGTVGGFAQMWKVLQRHKDWRDAIPKMMATFEKEKAHKAWLRRTNKFCPEWKNLQTWLNQRCWENEYENTEEAPEWQDTVLWEQYLENLGQMVTEVPYYMTEQQYREWAFEQGPFQKMSRKHSPSKRREIFIAAHRQLVADATLVARHGGLYECLIKLSK